MIVAVLGTGTMGEPMARLIAERAFGDVRVWNRASEKAEPLGEAGCTVAATAEEAVDGADAVVTMLSDGDAVLEVLDRILPAMAEGSILVQMSTVGMAATEAIAARTQEHGVTFVDAPVIGTRQPAEKGRLVVLASGPEEALQRVGAIFDAVGMNTIGAGEAGGGTRLKLVVNAWLVSLTESLAETIGLAEAIGVDPKSFLHTIAGGPLDVKYAHLKGNAMIDREFEPASFALSLAHKDAELVLEAAGRHDVQLPVVETVARQMAAAIEDGHGEADMAATFLATCRAR